MITVQPVVRAMAARIAQALTLRRPIRNPARLLPPRRLGLNPAGYRLVGGVRGGPKLEHRFTVEAYYERQLNRRLVVHHVDEDKQNNGLDNLVVMTAQDHALHQAVVRACMSFG